MLSTCVVVDHRPDDYIVPPNNTRRHFDPDRPMEKYYDLPLPSDKILATYIWIDDTGQRLRFKDKTLDYIPKTPKDKLTLKIEEYHKNLLDKMLANIKSDQSEKYLPPYDYYPRNLENIYKTECRLRTDRNINIFDENIKDLPIITFDGFGTQQAELTNSDMFLCPRAIYRNPFRCGNHLLVMCDTYDMNMEPTTTNYRVKCADAYEKCKQDEPWFGIEQEYFFLTGSDLRPMGWPKGGYPRRADIYYCGVGADRVTARDIINAHARCCIFAGIPLYGTNAEIGPSQWEYQIGPSVGVNAGDDLWIARFICESLAEEYGVVVTLDPKPFKGWDGSGAHTNFSTKQMREENGIEAIESAIRKLEQVHEKHIKVYDPRGGKDNRRRLTGAHETEQIDVFSAGVAGRFCSIRIPRLVSENKKGFLEDRRPASNCDPYRTINALMRTCILNEEILLNPIKFNIIGRIYQHTTWFPTFRENSSQPIETCIPNHS